MSPILLFISLSFSLSRQDIPENIPKDVDKELYIPLQISPEKLDSQQLLVKELQKSLEKITYDPNYPFSFFAPSVGPPCRRCNY